MNISLTDPRLNSNIAREDRQTRSDYRARFPRTSCEVRLHPGTAKGHFGDASENKALPKVMNLAKAMEAGADALIISCAVDPAVERLKEMLCISVGVRESAAAVACVLGKGVGVITLSSQVPGSALKRLGNHFLFSQPVLALRAAANLASHAIRHILDAATQLKNKASDVIVLGCTGFTALGVASLLNRTVNVLVVDPLIAAGVIVYR